MGGCISFQISCDQVLNRVGSCFCGKGNYIRNLETNLVALEKAMGVLKARRDDVLTRVQREEGKGQERLHEVQVWLTSVQTIETNFHDLNVTRTVELQRLCLFGVCSKNLKSSFHYGRRVSLMLKEVEDLKSNGVFEVVSEPPAMRYVVEERPLQPIIFGGETMLERAWNRLMDDETGVMGLYGMGGVGKTTLLTQINNKFREAVVGVQIVIWIVVSNDLRVEKIQDEIADKLGLVGEEWNRKEERHKVTDIHTHMKKKKFVLLLDDIWRKVDLTEIGVPFPTKENGCKVVFTTRSSEVCGHMGVDDPIEVQCLAKKEAWDLFKRKVGPLTLKSHPSIPEQARKVAEKCCGLPLALNVIDYLIEKEKLIDYWTCEGFISEKKGREGTINQGYEIIGTLVRACLLLEEGSNRSKVKMHDVVREMALWISSDLGENREKCIVRAGVGLCEVPEVERWSSVERMSLMNNKIEEISGSPKCPKLTTLFLQGNMPLASISGEFFRFMPNLAVLDLSQNSRLDGLPEEISELVSLRYLDLSRTMIRRLPACLGKLKKLMHLHLEGTRSLRSIQGISKLSSLRTLTLLRCNKLSFDDSLKELFLLKHLEVLTIEVESKMILEQLFYSPLWWRKCIQTVVFKNTGEDSFGFFTLPTNLRSPKGLCFQNLTSVAIEGCKGLKDLTWLLFAPKLIHLRLTNLSQLEEVVSKERADKQQVLQGVLPFENLETLVMLNLPVVESIYWTPLPFPCLREMHIELCPRLRKLPLDSNSVAEVEGFVIKCEAGDWIEGIEWEDEATRLRFLSSRKMVVGYCY
ncbi:unnamed protein product [Thlaspi arvense]|uniref:NB-ARC domain-containing protein n=1 Tax=Thlaspi arvense TaxID=13288 RepID=A0AAU9RDG3_THLAR|nr:unnamed protein product [Thlaspi arvense]